MSITIKEVAFVCHTVSDIPRARKFYEGVLGLKHLMNAEFAPGVWWVEYDIAGTALAVTNAQPPTPGGASLSLEVKGLDETREAIKAAGIEATFEVMDFPTCKIFGITTPDGYSVMFHEHKA